MPYIPIARKRVGKHIPATQALNIRGTSIARQRTSKHAFLTTAGGIFRGVRAKWL
jgi:hypothetical protein